MELGERFKKALADKMAEVIVALNVEQNGVAPQLAGRKLTVDEVNVRVVLAVTDVETGETQAVNQEYPLLVIRNPFTEQEQIRIPGFKLVPAVPPAK